MLVAMISKGSRRRIWVGCSRYLSDGAVKQISILSTSSADSAKMVVGCREPWPKIFSALHGARHYSYHQSSLNIEVIDTKKEKADPFSLVTNDLSRITARLRSMMTTEVPELASAAAYLFKAGAEGKKIRPTVLLLMTRSFNLQKPDASLFLDTSLLTELSEREQRIAEVTEIIHVASLFHDDVIDEADTRRGIDSLNFVMGNKLAILAGNFLLSRAFVALATLKNTEVVSLFAAAVHDLITGETMQITATAEKCCSVEFYLEKTYRKTGSLFSNSCKATALVSGQTAEVATLAFEYGKNLGLAFQLVDDILDFTGTSASLGKASLSDIQHGILTAPVLFAMEEYPQLNAIIDKGFDDPANLDLVLEYLKKSNGIQRTKELAIKHSAMAATAINSLPETTNRDAMLSRQALIDLTEIVLTRNK